MDEELGKVVEGFKGVATASVSDAVDRVMGRRGFMSHKIKPVFPVKMAGPAVTVLNQLSLKPTPPVEVMQAIEEAEPGSVLVIAVEDGEDITGWGGLLTAGAVAKGLGGTVTDGGVRDVGEIEEAEYPVFAGSVVPSTSVGRYSTTGVQVPITCGGVLVSPGDIIVGDRDGVVVVPRGKAAEVLKTAQEIEETERQMTQEITKLGSLLKAYQRFTRI